MKNILILFGLMLTGTYGIYAQETIPVDIVKLSEITLAKNPIIKRNKIN